MNVLIQTAIFDRKTCIFRMKNRIKSEFGAQTQNISGLLHDLAHTINNGSTPLFYSLHNLTNMIEVVLRPPKTVSKDPIE